MTSKFESFPMEGGLPAAQFTSFFHQLKDGITTISRYIADAEEGMRVPIVDLSEDSALIETVNMAAEVKQMKSSASQMKINASKINEDYAQYYGYMESIVKDMEKSVENIQNIYKKYGYEPPVLPDELRVPQNGASTDNNYPSKFTEDANQVNISIENEFGKTPILISSRIPSQFNTAKVKCLFPSEENFASKSLDDLGINENTEHVNSLIASGDDATLTLNNLNLTEKSISNDIINRCTPEEPLLRSLKKSRAIKAVDTPEEPTVVYCPAKEDDFMPSTPKTPVLLSLRKS